VFSEFPIILDTLHVSYTSMYTVNVNYSRSNSTNSLASGASNVSEPRLMSQVGRVCGLVCPYIRVFLHSERCRREYSSADVVAAIT
jgi:hypothetical protein